MCPTAQKHNIMDFMMSFNGWFTSLQMKIEDCQCYADYAESKMKHPSGWLADQSLNFLCKEKLCEHKQSCAPVMPRGYGSKKLQYSLCTLTLTETLICKYVYNIQGTHSKKTCSIEPFSLTKCGVNYVLLLCQTYTLQLWVPHYLHIMQIALTTKS